MTATATGRNLIQRVNMGDTLTRSAWRDPSKEAVVDGQLRVTYGELNQRVNRFANALAARGHRRGDALALMSGNSLEFLVTYYACAKLGIVCVPINLSWRREEIAYVLGHAQAKGVVVESQLVAPLLTALEDASEVREVIVAPGTGERRQAPTDGRAWIPFEELSAQGSDAEPDAFVEDRDPITYLYTSGTTSAPKGVASSHLAVFVESHSAVIDIGLSRSDRMLCMMPLFHTAQLNAFSTPVLLVGGTLVLLRAFDPGLLLALVEAERLTHIFGLPMMYRAMLDHPQSGKHDLSSLRLAVYAMAPMPDADLRRGMEVFGCDFALGFGQTEMAPITTVFRPEHQLSHTGSVGTPSINVQVGIMDEDGRLLPAGRSGEIVYRGPHTMEGYLRNPQATEDAFAHGWFHSGDVGHFDADGILWFEDRRKDVIKTGGENVASIEVERALYAAEPRLQEVVVVGLPHPRWSEAVTAIAIARPGEALSGEEVLAKARDRLAGFKAPKALILVDEFPRTSTGKVQKNVLREAYRDFFKQDVGAEKAGLGASSKAEPGARPA